MNTIYILGGSNLGDCKDLLKQAELSLIERIGEVIISSSIGISEAWGFKSENKFYNQLWVVQTPLIAYEILDVLQSIEIFLGRTPKTQKGYESRYMDLDILFFNEEIIQSQRLTIPHPLLHKRLFTLNLLAEIAPNLVHPVLNKTILNLQQELQLNP